MKQVTIGLDEILVQRFLERPWKYLPTLMWKISTITGIKSHLLPQKSLGEALEYLTLTDFHKDIEEAILDPLRMGDYSVLAQQLPAEKVEEFATKFRKVCLGTDGQERQSWLINAPRLGGQHFGIEFI